VRLARVCELLASMALQAREDAAAATDPQMRAIHEEYAEAFRVGVGLTLACRDRGTARAVLRTIDRQRREESIATIEALAPGGGVESPPSGGAR